MIFDWIATAAIIIVDLVTSSPAPTPPEAPPAIERCDSAAAPDSCREGVDPARSDGER